MNSLILIKCFFIVVLLVLVTCQSVHTQTNNNNQLHGVGKKLIEYGEDIITYESRVRAYWTIERMMNAKPFTKHLNQLNKFKLNQSNINELEQQNGTTMKSGFVEGYNPYANSATNSSSKSKRSVAFVAGTSHVAPDDYAMVPYQMAGKIFFMQDGLNFVCTGSVQENNTLITAGHCVHNADSGWSKNVMFVPQYRKGNRPKGTFVAHNLISFNSWINDENFGRDVGFGKLGTNSKGVTAVAAIGYLGFIYGFSWNSVFLSLGYPVKGNNVNYDGSIMIQTYARATKRDNKQPQPIGIITSMRNGASGGPWIYDAMVNGKGNNNYVAGINSYYHTNINDGLLFSPYFDQYVFNLRNEVIAGVYDN